MNNQNKLMSRRAMLKGASAAFVGSAVMMQNPLRVFASTTNVYTQTRVMLGTFVTINAVHSSKDQAYEAMGKAFEEVQKLEAELTRHNASAPLAVLNASGKIYDAPKSLLHVLNRAKSMHSVTSGAFDMTVAPLLGVYKAAQNQSGSINLDKQAVNAAKELMQASEVFVSEDHVRLGRSGMALTLDGIAKGYIADRASEMLATYGVNNHLVNAGGDIRTSGLKDAGMPWRVAVENPARNGKTIASFDLYGAVATSGSYEMYYDAKKEYHHLIDPRLKQSPQHTVSVTVTAPTALEADGLATALSVLPVRDALALANSLPKRECLILTSQGQVLKSNGFAG